MIQGLSKEEKDKLVQALTEPKDIDQEDEGEDEVLFSSSLPGSFEPHAVSASAIVRIAVTSHRLFGWSFMLSLHSSTG